MARIVLATMGSLGGLHPIIALGLELKRRGHQIVLNTWTGYQEKIAALGFEFRPLRPDVDIEDVELLRKVMDRRKGPEAVIKDLMFPALRDTYYDVTSACDGADLLINGEIVYVASSVVEKTGIKWVSQSLAPISMFSSYDPSVYPTAELIEYLRPLPAVFHHVLLGTMKWAISDWFAPFRQFRRDIGLRDDVDPVFEDKYSPDLHLAMFSRAIGPPQPDWPKQTVQTGFCFYDESESVALDPALAAFLDAGEPPVIFTLGSAAVLDARDFFEHSARAARILGRRAVLLYGSGQPPAGLDNRIVGFEFAPYSLVFPKAACVVHQGGIGTTGQVLRAGTPHVIMPFSHDQPDNAARCRRIGVAEIVARDRYNADTAADVLRRILHTNRYRVRSHEASEIVRSETGTDKACNAIEAVLV